jgi:hypothetical protein
LGIVVFVINIRTASAQETGITPEQLKVLQEKVDELQKPQLPEEGKPKEKGLEVGQAYIPLERPLLPPTTLQVREITGILAPYQYPGAMDTLQLGWRGHKVGPFLLTPFFGYDSLYRSNIFQTYSNKQGDWLNLLSANLHAQLPWARTHSLSFGYLGNYFLYSRLGNNSHADNNFNTEVRLNFPKGLQVRGGAAYRAAQEEQSATTPLRFYQRFTPYFQATHHLADKWQIQGNYQFDLLQFAGEENQPNNRRDNNIGATLSYKFWPKTSFLAQYLFQRRSFPDEPTSNNSTHAPYFGLTWDPTAKLTGTVKFGYSWTAFDTQIPDRDNNPNAFSMSIQTLYRYNRYNQFGLVAQRSTQQDLDSNNDAYENTAFYLAWNRKWEAFKIESEVVFSYANNSYLEEAFNSDTNNFQKRLDNLVTVGLNLSRPLSPYFRLRVYYQYQSRSSNFNVYTYNENRVGAGIHASF